MSAPWQPYREPLSATLSRTAAIAIAVGGALAWRFGRLQLWPVAACLVLWFSFGGHWVELGFLNWLRPRIAPSRLTQVVTRLGVWFVGGVVLGIGVVWSMRFFPLTRSRIAPSWWLGGVLFAGVELIAHGVLFARHRRNFYRGDG